jgi:hypothetical protein
MFSDLIDYPIVNERLEWEAREMVQRVAQVPHLLTRLKLTGTFFQRRAAEAFVTVGGVRSQVVRFAGDGLSVYAYFYEPLPRRGTVEFGYGSQAMLRFPQPFDVAKVDRISSNRVDA